MHRGCFVWTPTPPLSGRRTPHPGPARVCLRTHLGRVGPAGLQGAFSRASPSPVAVLSFVHFWFVRPIPGWGCPVCGCFRVFVFSSSFFFLVAPPLSLSFQDFRPGLPWALASCGPPAPPSRFLLFLFCFFLFFVLFPLPPPPDRFLFFSAPLACLFAAFFFVFFLRWCAGNAVFALVCVSCAVGCAGVCCCGPCAPAGPFCACAVSLVAPCSVCVVACLAAVSWCVLCFARCCVACLCSASFFPCAAAPWCRCLVPCCGPWLCCLLGCGAALLWWSFVVRCGAVCVVSCWWCRVV